MKRSPLFKLDTLQKSEESIIKDVEVKSTQYVEQHQLKLSDIDKELGELPSEGQVMDVLSLKSINAFSLIVWVLTQTSYIQNLYISTYSLSLTVSNAIFRLQQEGKIKHVVLLMSDSLIKRNPLVVDNAKAQANGNANVKLIFGWNHTKISLTETADQRFLSITGSGNFSKNAQFENYIIRNSEEIYRFYENWFLNFKSKA